VIVWANVCGFIAIGWALLAITAKLAVGKATTWVAWAAGVAGAISTLTAGAWITDGTWLYEFIGWAVHISPVVSVIAGAVLIIAAVWLLAALLPDNVLPVASVTTGVAVLAALLPSLALQAAPDGRVGEVIADAVSMVTTETMNATRGWFTLDAPRSPERVQVNAFRCSGEPVQVRGAS
jgi:hypothetical protein